MDDKKYSVSGENGRRGYKSIDVDLPSNSFKTKGDPDLQEKRERIKAKKVIKGAVVSSKQAKKSLFSSFKETFLGETLANVSSYIVHDILIPAAKSTLSEMIHGSADIMIHGERRGGYNGRREGRTHVRYDKASYQDDNRRPEPRRNRERNRYDDIVLERKSDAEYVIDCLVEHIREFDDVNVAFLYELVDLKPEYTDRNWGWVNLRTARVTPVKGGWLLDLPRPVLLD